MERDREMLVRSVMHVKGQHILQFPFISMGGQTFADEGYPNPWQRIK